MRYNYKEIFSTIEYKMLVWYGYDYKIQISEYKKLKEAFNILDNKEEIDFKEEINNIYSPGIWRTLLDLECIEHSSYGKYQISEKGGYIKDTRMIDDLIKKSRKNLWKDRWDTTKLFAFLAFIVGSIIIGCIFSDDSSSAAYYGEDYDYEDYMIDRASR